MLLAEGSLRAVALATSLAHYLPLVQQVIHQTTRRVFNGESVPASEKLVSLFEQHTAIIRRGKARPHETEYGRKVWYAESDGGLITHYALFKGNPPETNQWLPSIQHHRKLFGHPPVEALPKPGAKSRAQHRRESQPWFKAVLRWRNGIEGRISQLRRARGLDRCLNHGEPGMERWLGWGIIANNLMVIAQALTRRRRKHHRRTA